MVECVAEQHQQPLLALLIWWELLLQLVSILLFLIFLNPHLNPLGLWVFFFSLFLPLFLKIFVCSVLIWYIDLCYCSWNFHLLWKCLRKLQEHHKGKKLSCFWIMMALSPPLLKILILLSWPIRFLFFFFYFQKLNNYLVSKHF